MKNYSESEKFEYNLLSQLFEKPGSEERYGTTSLRNIDNLLLNGDYQSVFQLLSSGWANANFKGIECPGGAKIKARETELKNQPQKRLVIAC